MGDSDDDGDYKRRDKFRSERRGYDGGGGRDGGSPPRREYRDARPGPPGGGGGGRRGGGGYEGKLSLENLLLKMDFIFISSTNSKLILFKRSMTSCQHMDFLSTSICGPGICIFSMKSFFKSLFL